MMNHSDFFDALLKIGMGWFGWTEQDTLATDMASIVLAREGRVDMLRYIFGGAAPDPETPPSVPAAAPQPAEPISQASIMSIFRAMTHKRENDVEPEPI